MGDELLKEFYISKCGEEYFTIKATDMAYSMLHLDEKVKTLANGVKVDTIDESYYRNAFITFLANNYSINGLVRISKGNSHDENQCAEVVIVNDGGLWKEELDNYRHQEAGAYEDKPQILDTAEFTKEIAEYWSKDFNLSNTGEGERLIYCSYKDNSKGIIYTLDHTYLYGNPINRLNISIKQEPRHLCLRKFYK